MPKINKNLTLIKAQNLPPEKAKELLNFILAHSYENDDLYKAAYVGLKIQEKQGATNVSN
jgi:hypothetical protein